MKHKHITVTQETETNITKLKEFYQEKTSSKTIGRALKDMVNVLGIK